MNLPPVIPLRVLALLIVCHFVACAYAWNPKTNRFVMELSLSSIVLAFCGVFTVNWYFVLMTTTIDEESLDFVASVTEDRWHSIGLGVLWIGALIGLLQKWYSQPVRRDTFGACAGLLLSGIAVGFTIAIPFRIETLAEHYLNSGSAN